MILRCQKWIPKNPENDSKFFWGEKSDLKKIQSLMVITSHSMVPHCEIKFRKAIRVSFFIFVDTHRTNRPKKHATFVSHE